MLRAAAARLAQLGTVTARSSLYSTAPLGGPAGQADYLNAVIALDLPDGDARELLRALLAIERDLGRVRNERWGPRIIDLDLLAVGDRVVGRQEGPDPGGPGNGADLVLPHPRIAERAFVLAPLCEIARRRNETGRAWVHPLTGLDACGMLAALATGVTRPPSLSDDLGVRRTDLRW
jgi:2-amino-4-hydroxy-6-hydroxymethyldihydropteridine diphosphokinase